MTMTTLVLNTTVAPVTAALDIGPPAGLDQVKILKTRKLGQKCIRKIISIQQYFIPFSSAATTVLTLSLRTCTKRRVMEPL